MTTLSPAAGSISSEAGCKRQANGQFSGPPDVVEKDLLRVNRIDFFQNQAAADNKGGPGGHLRTFQDQIVVELADPVDLNGQITGDGDIQGDLDHLGIHPGEGDSRRQDDVFTTDGEGVAPDDGVSQIEPHLDLFGTDGLDQGTGPSDLKADLVDGRCPESPWSSFGCSIPPGLRG